MAADKAFEAVVHGRVQGVGFRAHTQDRALALGLVGHVANRWDGAVEVYAEGSEDALRQLLAWLHRGPTFARVDRVEVHWVAPGGAEGRFAAH
ncbi:MAG: acylphosphatase [Chloroflexi bacterium]|nr:acylphosphatase [Chloroflexota bacterium]